MKTFTLFTMILLSKAAFAMPCDTGYTCTSASGAYQIEIQTCRYTNSVGLTSLKLAGKDVQNATIGHAFDATYDEDKGPLYFEVNLPATEEEAANGSVRILQVEIPALKPASKFSTLFHRKKTSDTVTRYGTIQEKFAEEEPAPFKVVKTESVTCVGGE